MDSRILEVGKTIKIDGKHNLKRVGAHEYSCSCPSWKFQNAKL